MEGDYGWFGGQTDPYSIYYTEGGGYSITQKWEEILGWTVKLITPLHSE